MYGRECIALLYDLTDTEMWLVGTWYVTHTHYIAFMQLYSARKNCDMSHALKVFCQIRAYLGG
jgi:hypothetical protein